MPHRDDTPHHPAETVIKEMWVGSDLYHVCLTKTAPTAEADEESGTLVPVLGRCNADDRIILVMLRKEKCSELQCLFHEFIHAIEAQVGRTIDEDMVRLVSRGLGQVVWQYLDWFVENTLAEHPIRHAPATSEKAE